MSTSFDQADYSSLIPGQYKIWTLDSIFRLEFQLPGVKGDMYINQQQSFEYIT